MLLGGTAAQSAGPVFELKRLPRCSECGGQIDDPAGAHDLGDARRWHPWCCPDAECRRIEQDVDGGW